MPIDLKKTIPHGRTFEEYKSMFNLTESELDYSILDCGGGPASFNYEMTVKGKKVVTVDPIFEFSRSQIEIRINETFDDIIEQVSKNKDKYVWAKMGNPEVLKETRKKAMDNFLLDYDKGLSEKRYRYGELPALNFNNQQFDLSLCSHFLFLYSNIFDEDFHIKSIKELLRISKEVRIFPIVDLNAKRSSHVEGVIEYFKNAGKKVEIMKSGYEFQKGGNEYLRITDNI